MGQPLSNKLEANPPSVYVCRFETLSAYSRRQQLDRFPDLHN